MAEIRALLSLGRRLLFVSSVYLDILTSYSVCLEAQGEGVWSLLGRWQALEGGDQGQLFT